MVALRARSSARARATPSAVVAGRPPSDATVPESIALTLPGVRPRRRSRSGTSPPADARSPSSVRPVDAADSPPPGASPLAPPGTSTSSGACESAGERASATVSRRRPPALAAGAGRSPALPASVTPSGAAGSAGSGGSPASAGAVSARAVASSLAGADRRSSASRVGSSRAVAGSARASACFARFASISAWCFMSEVTMSPSAANDVKSSS